MLAQAAIFDILAAEKLTAADSALLAALPNAPTATAVSIVETLLQRDTPVGLRGLVNHFHELTPGLQQRVLEEMQQLFRVLREASQSRNEQVRLNVVEIVHRGNAYRAAYLLDSGLHDRSPAVRRAAAEAIYSMADRIYGAQPVDLPDDATDLSPEAVAVYMRDLETYREDRRQVIGALDAGLNSFGMHLHPRVIEAATWFVDDLGQRFWALVTAPGSRAHHVASSLLQQPLTPRIAPFAMTAIGYSGFRPHVARALSTCTDPEFFASFSRESWRLQQPRVGKGMVAVKDLACLSDRAKTLVHMPGDALRHAAAWIGVTGIPEESKLLVLRELFQQGTPDVKRSAIWALGMRPDDRVIALLRPIARAGDESYSPALARLVLACRRPTEFTLRTLVRLARGEDVKLEPAKPPVPKTFEQYWLHYDELLQEDRVKLGKAMLEQTPRATSMLGNWLTDADAGHRIRALRIACTLDLVSPLAEHIYPLTHDAEPTVRSTAVMALGQLPNATGKHLVRQALRDPDERVQANAVEVVGESGDADTSRALLPLLASKDNRVRANAVKALLKLGVRDAAETLLGMLSHSNRAQRISALWLIEHMGLLTLVTRVVNMAHADADTQVRTRAYELAQRLESKPSSTGVAAGEEVSPSAV